MVYNLGTKSQSCKHSHLLHQDLPSFGLPFSWASKVVFSRDKNRSRSGEYFCYCLAIHLASLQIFHLFPQSAKTHIPRKTFWIPHQRYLPLLEVNYGGKQALDISTSSVINLLCPLNLKKHRLAFQIGFLKLRFEISPRIFKSRIERTDPFWLQSCGNIVYFIVLPECYWFMDIISIRDTSPSSIIFILLLIISSWHLNSRLSQH